MMIFVFNSKVREISSKDLFSTKNNKRGNKQFASKLSPICFASLIALGSVSVAQAAIVADMSQPNTQASISTAMNGSTIVNINAAGSGGISHNIYTQFNVEKEGVVLNNSTENVNTNLAGRVGANDRLSGNSAKIILNEVNSRNRSNLYGMIEVAGEQAQVIIANSSGITCNGCGFINADRATLTTGKAQIVNDHLQGYRVEEGNIVISGTGLKNGDVNYTDLITRSVNVNAGIWAQELDVIVGTNRTSVNEDYVGRVTPKEGTVKPYFAIDVSRLGGMYAGKISLLGTEDGVGVHNQGNIKSFDDIDITIDGKIHNSGLIKADSRLFIHTLSNSLTNVGNGKDKGIIGDEHVVLKGGDLRNLSGLIKSDNVIEMNYTNSIDNTNGNITTSDGRITSPDDYDFSSLVIHTDTLKNTNGRISTGSLLVVSTDGELDNSRGQLISTGWTSVETNEGALNNSRGSIKATSKLSIDSGKLNNNGGMLYAADELIIDTYGYALTNNNDSGSASIIGGNVGLFVGSLNNNGGKIFANDFLYIESRNGISNSGGIMGAKDPDMELITDCAYNQPCWSVL